MSDFVTQIEKFREDLGVSGGQPFSKEERETLYAAAFGKYQIGEYNQAGDFFTMLLLHDPYDTRFWKGLAASKQMEKNYRAALRAWAIFALLTGHSPMGHFHAAECYLSMGAKEEAKKALHLAETFMEKENPMQDRVLQLKERIDE